MSENETIEAQGAEAIPQAELAEGELENVAGGGAWMLIGAPSIITVMPVIAEGTDGTDGTVS